MLLGVNTHIRIGLPSLTGCGLKLATRTQIPSFQLRVVIGYFDPFVTLCLQFASLIVSDKVFTYARC